MKKMFAVVLAVTLLIGASAWPVSAAEAAVSVYIDAPAQIEPNETVPVALYVNGDEVGGVQGTIVYRTDEVEFLNVVLRDDVKLLGNNEDVTVAVDNGVGQIKFVVTSNVVGGNAPADAWLTANFRMKENESGSKVSIALQNVVISDRTGDHELSAEAAPSAVTRVVTAQNAAVDLKGATIRTSVQSQGIRFESNKATGRDLSGLTEAGVLFFPTQLLYEGQDLTLETVGKNGTVPAVAKVDGTNADDLNKIKGGEAFYATLTNGTTGGRANVKISVRSYMIINGVTYYSHNDDAKTNVDNGMAGKSLVSVAQAIAQAEIAGGANEDSLNGLQHKIGILTDPEVLTLLTFCRDNIAYLEQ